MVEAKPSEVPPDQLALLRQHKAELLPVLAEFGTAMVHIRPPTPIPPPIVMGAWEVWSEPLEKDRSRRMRRDRSRAADAGDSGWTGPGPNPCGCIHCREHVWP